MCDPFPTPEPACTPLEEYYRDAAVPVPEITLESFEENLYVNQPAGDKLQGILNCLAPVFDFIMTALQPFFDWCWQNKGWITQLAQGKIQLWG